MSYLTQLIIFIDLLAVGSPNEHLEIFVVTAAWLQYLRCHVASEVLVAHGRLPIIAELRRRGLLTTCLFALYRLIRGLPRQFLPGALCVDVSDISGRRRIDHFLKVMVH